MKDRHVDAAKRKLERGGAAATELRLEPAQMAEAAGGVVELPPVIEDSWFTPEAWEDAEPPADPTAG